MASNSNHRRPSRPGRTPIKRSGNDRSIPTRRKKKKSIVPRAICLFASCTALFVLAVMVLGNQDGVSFGQGFASETIAPAATASPAAADVLADAAVTDATTQAAPEPTQDPVLLAALALAQEMQEDPFMILVSINSLMPDDYVVEEVLADSNTGKTLDATAAYAYMDMVAAAANDGITLRLQSAYRSVSYQATLFENQIQKWIGWGYSEEEATVQAATVVNPPGASEHGCGLAADINCPEYYALEEGFEDTTAFAWLCEHAVEYGYILRYPKEDQDATGITYEPWHWRYVGVENAAIIKESGLCLEDFLIELAAIATGTSSSDVITGTAAWQARLALG